MNVGNNGETQENIGHLSQFKEGMISLAAMLNSHGHGVVYFGVSPEGVPQADENESYWWGDIPSLKRRAEKNFSPVPKFKMSIGDTEDGKSFLKIEASGTQAPYWAYGRMMLREGNKNVLPRKEDILPENDLMSILPYRIQELSFDGIKGAILLKEGRLDEDDILERELGLRNENGEYNLLAGMLCDFVTDTVRLALFSGTDKGSDMLIYNPYYEDDMSLPLQMMKVLFYMESINATRVIFEFFQRKHLPLFDYICFKEAWINACLHTDWARERMSPMVGIFSDRIEVFSYGRIVGMDREGFLSGKKITYNKGLRRVFSRLGFLDDSFGGVRQLSARLGPTNLETEQDRVNIVIPFNYDPSTYKVTKKKVDGIEKEIIYLLSKKDKPALPHMAKELGISIPSLKKKINVLVEKGYLMHLGHGDSESWLVRDVAYFDIAREF